MKSLYNLCVVAGIAVVIFFNGCELITQDTQKAPPGDPGEDLVINEVFAVSPDKYSAYSWIELYNPTNRTIPWLTDEFPAFGFSVGANGTFLGTTDDGSSWTAENSGTPSANFNAVDFVYSDTACVVGDNGLVRLLTRPANGSFTATNLTIPNPQSNLKGVAFAPFSRVGYVVGSGGRILRTTNMGGAWTSQTITPASSQTIRAISFLTFSKIYACGDTGTVVKRLTGLTWGQLTIPQNYRQTNFHGLFFASDTGWVVGENGTILHTTNAGAFWTPETSGVTSTLRSGFAHDEQQFTKRRAWVCGDGGVIRYTENNGVTQWREQVSGTSANLNRIEFVDSLRGWAFGDNGTIVRTTNGGSTWRAQLSNTTENLTASKFLPLSIRVRSRFVLSMVGKRKQFFFDPTTNVTNFDFFTKIDTGLLIFDPQILADLRVGSVPTAIPPGAFIVVNNDSNRFKDHTKLGPGVVKTLNVSIGYYFDPSTFEYRPVLWDLLSAGEIRLLKFGERSVVSSGQILGGFSKVVDVVRYGGYYPNPLEYPPNELYPNNVAFDCAFGRNPSGGCVIPEGWSLARYANDVGTNPDRQSTAKSFFMTKDPIPGWFSQESRQQ